MTIYKQPGTTVITPTMILWLLSAKDSTHDLSNAKKMAKKTDPLLERQTWTQPTSEYMQMQQLRRRVLQ